MFSISGRDLDLWADVIQFAVAQSPQHVLCCITTHPKIEGMERREQLPPYLQRKHKQQSINTQFTQFESAYWCQPDTGKCVSYVLPQTGA